MRQPLWAKLIREAGRLVDDLRGLAAARYELVRLETVEALRVLAWAAAAAAAAIALAVAAVALASGAAGLALADWLQWPPQAGLGLAALVLTAGAALCLWIGYRRLKRELALWEQTREELAEDVAWLAECLAGEAQRDDADGPPEAAAANGAPQGPAGTSAAAPEGPG